MYLAVLIGSSVVLLSTTRDAGDSDAGSNPALSKQWSRDYPIDVPHSPMLTFATKKLSTGANGQKEDAASFFCPRSFDRAVMDRESIFLWLQVTLP